MNAMSPPPLRSATSNAVKFVIGHVLAGVALISGILLLAAVLYGFGLATAPSGVDNPVAVIPEFLFWMLIAFTGALACSTLCFLTTCLFQWFRRKFGIPAWLPPLLVSPIALTVSAAIWWPNERAAAWGFGWGFSLSFASYWSIVASSNVVADYFFARLAKPCLRR